MTAGNGWKEYVRMFDSGKIKPGDTIVVGDTAALRFPPRHNTAVQYHVTEDGSLLDYVVYGENAAQADKSRKVLQGMPWYVEERQNTQ